MLTREEGLRKEVEEVEGVEEEMNDARRTTHDARKTDDACLTECVSR